LKGPETLDSFLALRGRETSAALGIGYRGHLLEVIRGEEVHLLIIPILIQGQVRAVSVQAGAGFPPEGQQAV
jgi:hypothetical protein